MDQLKSNRSFTFTSVAVFFAFAGMGCAGGNSSPSSYSGHQASVQPEGVDNFGVVSPEVWRGAKPTSSGLRTLAAMGVKTIIDLQEDDESADVPAGVLYVPIRTSQWHADRVDTAAVLTAIAESPKPVFIHCLQGRDRTGLAVAAYRLSRGTGPDDAMKELQAFHINFWWRGPIENRVRELARAGSVRPPL